MKIVLVNLHDVEARCFLEYLDTAIEDYEFYLRDFPAREDPNRETREYIKRELRLLRKLRRQVAAQVPPEAD